MWKAHSFLTMCLKRLWLFQRTVLALNLFNNKIMKKTKNGLSWKRSFIARRRVEPGGRWVMAPLIWFHVSRKSVLFKIIWKDFRINPFWIRRIHEDTLRSKNSRYSLKNELNWKTIHSMNLPWINSLFCF